MSQPVDNRSIEFLLTEQRLMVQKCMEDARQCLDLNEALTKKLTQEQLVTSIEKEPIMASGRETELGFGEPAIKASDLKEPLLPLRTRKTNVMQEDESEENKPSKVRGLFTDGHSVRDRVLRALKEPVYKVEDLYKDSGFAQRVAKDDAFMYVTFIMIALNTLWMAIETDYNKAIVLSEAPFVFQVVDNLFTIFFVFEISLRLSAFRRKKDALNDGWFVFDSILVFLMVWETYIIIFIYKVFGAAGGSGGSKNMAIFRLFRLLRLTRIARLARVLRAVPELMVLAKAMVMALRSVGATIMLLLLVIYVFSIVFTQLFSDTELGKGYFENMPQTFNTLLMAGVFTDPQPYMLHMLEGSIVYYLLIIFFLLVSTFTVLNMLIGVICEVIGDVANREREDMIINDLRYKIGKISSHFKQDINSDGDEEPLVSREDVLDLLKYEEAAKALNEIGVDVVSLVDLVDFIFPDDEDLELSKFLQTVLQFRGSNTATVKDVVDMRRFISHQLSSFANRTHMVKG